MGLHGQTNYFCLYAYKQSLSDALSKSFAGSHNSVLIHHENIILSDECITKLKAASADNPDVVLGCRLRDINQRHLFQCPGWRWNSELFGWYPEWYINFKADPSMPRAIVANCLSPDVLLIPRSAWEKTGDFDSQLEPGYAVIDWCLRARRANVECLEIQHAIAFKHRLEPTKPTGPWGMARIGDIKGLLILSGRYQLPMKPMWLAIRYIYISLSKELGRVHYNTDYGSKISHAKRLLWYINNLFSAFKRAHTGTLLYNILASIRYMRIKHRTP